MLETAERKAAEDRVRAAEKAERERRIEEEIEAERDRQAQAAAAEAERGRQARVRAEIAAEGQKWLHEIEEAEAGAKAMVEAIRVAFATAGKINLLMASLRDVNRIANPETADRLSRRLSQLLSSLGAGHQFGQLVLFAGIQDADASWPNGEQKNAPWLEFIGVTDDKDR
jgi:hypothetical protein